MALLIIGLVLFLGVHSLRIVAEPWRNAVIANRGENTFKGVYSLASLLGLGLLIAGYSQTRLDPVFLWHPPAAMAHLASLLVLVAFVLLAAAYIPGNRIKRAVGHPMALGVKVWALAHLLANGRLGDVILFGAFLVWAVMSFVSSRKRDRRDGVIRAQETSIAKDSATVIVGSLAWLVFAMWLHVRLIGVSPFGG